MPAVAAKKIKNKQERINFKSKKLNSALIQNDEILVIFQNYKLNCKDPEITECCCALCKQLRKLLAVVQVE